MVNTLDDAIAHIAKHSTHHSDAIITADKAAAQRFTACVDSAAVYVNASTRFTDGGEFGLARDGREPKAAPPRPMGLAELCTYRRHPRQRPDPRRCRRQTADALLLKI